MHTVAPRFFSSFPFSYTDIFDEVWTKSSKDNDIQVNEKKGISEIDK